MLNCRHALVVVVLKNIFCDNFTDDDLTSGLPLKYDKSAKTYEVGYVELQNLQNLENSRYTDFSGPDDDIPLYEPLIYAGLARVDLLDPVGMNFSVTGKQVSNLLLLFNS